MEWPQDIDKDVLEACKLERHLPIQTRILKGVGWRCRTCLRLWPVYEIGRFHYIQPLGIGSGDIDCPLCRNDSPETKDEWEHEYEFST